MTETNNWVLYSAACKHLEHVQKIVDQPSERGATDELDRLTKRLYRLFSRPEPENTP
jgi:hypothetical protein